MFKQGDKVVANLDGSSMKAGEFGTVIEVFCIDSDPDYIIVLMEDGRTVVPSYDSYWSFWSAK